MISSSISSLADFRSDNIDTNRSDNIDTNTYSWQFVVVPDGDKICVDCNICSHCLIEHGAVVGDWVTKKPACSFGTVCDPVATWLAVSECGTNSVMVELDAETTTLLPHLLRQRLPVAQKLSVPLLTVSWPTWIPSQP